MKKFCYVLVFLVLLTLIGLGAYYLSHNIKKDRIRIPMSFKPNLSFSVTPKKANIKIILGGDVMLGRSVRNTISQLKDNKHPFLQIESVLNTADLILVNLENPIISNCPYHDGGYKFCSDVTSVETLKYGSVDIANIANNHTFNYGKPGFEETKKILSDSGIDYTGDNNLIIKEFGKTKIGFLGFDFTVNKPTSKDFEFVKNSDLLVDVLIVAIHWGVEYKPDPQNYQRGWAREFVDLGADIIAGTHPHWVQGADCINGAVWQYFDRAEMAEKLKSEKCDKLVFYSLGNFVFDQMWSEETKKGAIAEINFEEKDIDSVQIYKTYIQKIGQPIIVRN